MPRSSETPSPPYPSIGLHRILERLAPLAKASTSKPLSVRHVLGMIGFGTLNGTSKAYINAARQYGLLATTEDGYMVSPEIREIARARQPGTRLRLLLEVAFRPPVFKALRTLHPEALGDGQEEARRYLAAQGFRGPAIEAVMSSYRSTSAFLDHLGASSDGGGPLSPDNREADAGAPPRDHATDDCRGPDDLPTQTSAGSACRPREAPSTRILFQYGFEGAGGIRLCMDGDVHVEAVIDAVQAWIDIKRAEMGRMARDPPTD